MIYVNINSIESFIFYFFLSGVYNETFLKLLRFLKKKITLYSPNFFFQNVHQTEHLANSLQVYYAYASGFA